MPIYDYHCDHCGHAFSAVQSFSDERLDVCANCGKRPRRLIAMPALVFKGSGWYKTDSRTVSASKEYAADAKTEAKPEAKTDAKTDAKKDAKKDGGGAPKADAPAAKDKPAAEAAS